MSLVVRTSGYCSKCGAMQDEQHAPSCKPVTRIDWNTPVQIQQQVWMIVERALAVSPLVEGREVYVPLSLLRSVLGMTDAPNDSDPSPQQSRVIDACHAVMDYLETGAGVYKGANGFEAVKVSGTINLVKLAEAIVGPAEWPNPADMKPLFPKAKPK